jgi:hypothetical protein
MTSESFTYILDLEMATLSVNTITVTDLYVIYAN